MLEDQYRAAKVKHADETTWRCDGKNGYAWGFFTSDVSLFRFRGSRASAVAKEVFGSGKHKGTLIVDRYSGYTAAWRGRLQDCYEHLKRDGLKVIEKGVKNKKDQALVLELIECLKFAMTLPSKKQGKAYRKASKELSDRIKAIVNTPVKDGGVKTYFEIFTRHPERMYNWVGHPEIESHNNLAEGRLRRLVISRKISYGSQSEEGLRIRETMMSICDTLAQRHDDPVAYFKTFLDEFVFDPDMDIGERLFAKLE